jgi:hypothetical protein
MELAGEVDRVEVEHQLRSVEAVPPPATCPSMSGCRCNAA